MKFRFEDYQGDYVMWCKTEEEAKDFCRVMHESGRKWKSGKSYKINNWILYKEHMCYVFNDNMFISKDDAIDDGYKILKWEDFMEKEFTLSDLKVGMLVVLRDERKYLIARTIDNELVGTRDSGYMHIDRYENDLSFEGCSTNDIVEVYNIKKSKKHMYSYSTDDRELLFQRKEPKELTMQEIADKFNIPVEQLKIKK